MPEPFATMVVQESAGPQRTQAAVGNTLSAMVHCLRWLDRWSPATAIVVGSLSIVVIGFVSYLTGPELSCSFLYLIPILLIARFGGFLAGFAAALSAGLIWLMADLSSAQEFDNPVSPYWNFSMRVSTFMAAAALVAAMRLFTVHLEQRVRERTTELEEQIAQNRQLEARILNLSDTERAAIGQDLHDGLCQQLVSTAFTANMLRSELVRIDLPSAGRAAQIADMIDGSITQARNLARGLYPVRLETDGLEMALQELATSTSQRHRIECSVECPESIPSLPQTVGIHLYRIAQEAVTNAIRHSQARELAIRLNRTGKGVRLEIADDGCGIRFGSSTATGMGLKIMEYRARMIGAGFWIRDRSEGGTLIDCEVPIQISPT